MRIAGDGGSSRSAASAGRGLSRHPRDTVFNLLVGADDWLILHLQVAAQRVRLLDAVQVRWSGPDPEVFGSENAHGLPRRRGREALYRLEQHWIGNLPEPPSPHDAELMRAGFRLARRMFSPALIAVLLDGRSGGSDIAVALASEDEGAVLRRMHGRCRAESLIARLRVRFGVTSFQLMRTALRPGAPERTGVPGPRVDHRGGR